MLDVVLVVIFTMLQMWSLWRGNDRLRTRLVFGLALGVYMLFQFTEFSNFMFMAQLVSLATWSISEVIDGFEVADAMLYTGLSGFVMCVLFALAMVANNPGVGVEIDVRQQAQRVPQQERGANATRVPPVNTDASASVAQIKANADSKLAAETLRSLQATRETQKVKAAHQVTRRDNELAVARLKAAEVGQRSTNVELRAAEAGQKAAEAGQQSAKEQAEAVKKAAEQAQEKAEAGQKAAEAGQQSAKKQAEADKKAAEVELRAAEAGQKAAEVDLAEVNAKLTKANGNIDEMLAMNEQLMTKVHAARADQEAAEVGHKAATQAKEEAEAGKQAAEVGLQATTVDLRQVEVEMQRAASTIATISTALAFQKETEQSLENHLAKTKQQNKVLTSDNAIMQKIFSATIRNNETEMVQAHMQALGAKVELAIINAAVADAESGFEELQSGFEELQASHDILNEGVNAATQEKETTMRETEVRIGTMRGELAAAEELASITQTQLTESTAKAKQQMEQLSAAAQEVGEIEKTTKELNVKLQAELDAGTAANEGVIAALTNAVKDTEVKLRIRVGAAQNIVDGLQKQLEATTDAIDQERRLLNVKLSTYVDDPDALDFLSATMIVSQLRLIYTIVEPTVKEMQNMKDAETHYQRQQESLSQNWAEMLSRAGTSPSSPADALDFRNQLTNIFKSVSIWDMNSMSNSLPEIN